MTEPGYTIKKARYAKGQMAIHCEKGPEWIKTRAMRLASFAVNGRYSNREKAYIVSPTKADRFVKLFTDHFDADVMTGEVFREHSSELQMLQEHGTKAFTLKPSSIVSAAVADLRTKEKNSASDDTNKHRWYTFHRRHVRKATSPAALLRAALSDRERGLDSGKPNTRMIYEDEALLKAACELCPS